MILVREATSADIAGIVPLWVELMQYHAAMSFVFELAEGYEKEVWEDVKAVVGSTHNKIFIAEEEGVILGFAAFAVIQRPPTMRLRMRGQINETYVRGKGKGTGTALINKIKEWFKAHDIEFITLMVAIQNEKSVNFWKKQGFGSLNYFMAQEIS
jgi:GNAT superfamily N-acetyltransferase